MDLRHFLTIGMILSGLLTIAFGMGYVWNIHYFAYFVTVQVPMIFFLMSYPPYAIPSYFYKTFIYTLLILPPVR